MAILSKLMVKALHKFKKLVYYKKNKPKRTESTGKGKDSTPQMLSEAVVKLYYIISILIIYVNTCMIYKYTIVLLPLYNQMYLRKQ